MKKPNINEPAILRANLKFTKPGFTPYQRRSNEKQKIHQVAKYLNWLGFGMIVGANNIYATHPITEIKVSFGYIETESYVQKTFSVTTKDGKKSNITTLRKMYPKN